MTPETMSFLLAQTDALIRKSDNLLRERDAELAVMGITRDELRTTIVQARIARLELQEM